MSKSNKRTAVRADKLRKRGAAYKAGGGKSKYAIKHGEQARGTFRPTSPFYGGADVTERDAQSS